MPLLPISHAPVALQKKSHVPAYGPYLLCGWKVFSALPLPELDAWPEGAPCRHAITLRLAGDALPHATEFAYTCEPGGSFLLQLPGVASFRVLPDATTVLMSPCVRAELHLLRAHLYGSVVAVLCFLQGLLPLHGSCVCVGGKAVLFTGQSGAGKSTLATAFAREGFRVLCDDVCAVDLAEEQPRVWPAFPRVKLLPDAIEAFQLEPGTFYTKAAAGEKGHFLCRETSSAVLQPASLPLAAIYLLGSSSCDNVAAEPLCGAAGFLPLRTQVHRSNMGAALGLRDRMFRDLSQLLARVPVFELHRAKSFARLPDLVRFITEAHSRGAEA